MGMRPSWAGAGKKVRSFPEGSGRKIALARAFMRDAEVMILDEPTSALDAEAEYEIYKRFRELMHGRIAVADFSPLFHRAYGGPDCGAVRRARSGGGKPRGIDAEWRTVRALV